MTSIYNTHGNNFDSLMNTLYGLVNPYTLNSHIVLRSTPYTEREILYDIVTSARSTKSNYPIAHSIALQRGTITFELDLNNIYNHNLSDTRSFILRILRDCAMLYNRWGYRFSFIAKGITRNDASAITFALIFILTNFSSNLVSLKIDCQETSIMDLDFRLWNQMRPDAVTFVKHVIYPELREMEIIWGSQCSVTHLTYAFPPGDVCKESLILTLFRHTPNLQTLTLDSLRPMINIQHWTTIKKLRIMNIYSLKAYLYYLSYVLPHMTELEDLELNFHEKSPAFDSNVPEILNYNDQRHLLKNLKKLQITTYFNEIIGLGIPENYLYDLDLAFILDKMPFSESLEYIRVTLPSYYYHMEKELEQEGRMEDRVTRYLRSTDCEFTHVTGGIQRRTGHYVIEGGKDRLL